MVVHAELLPVVLGLTPQLARNRRWKSESETTKQTNKQTKMSEHLKKMVLCLDLWWHTMAIPAPCRAVIVSGKPKVNNIQESWTKMYRSKDVELF